MEQRWSRRQRRRREKGWLDMIKEEKS